eukprot:scaffold2200_cov413-Prasinococcus_capsulatus_cf.AAC.5
MYGAARRPLREPSRALQLHAQTGWGGPPGRPWRSSGIMCSARARPQENGGPRPWNRAALSG